MYFDRHIGMRTSACEHRHVIINMWVRQTHRHANISMLSSTCEFYRQIGMLSSTCEFDRHISTRTSACYHLVSSTDTSACEHQHVIILWVRQTHRHVIINMWFRQTHKHANISMLSSCEFDAHVGDTSRGSTCINTLSHGLEWHARSFTRACVHALFTLACVHALFARSFTRSWTRPGYVPSHGIIDMWLMMWARQPHRHANIGMRTSACYYQHMISTDTSALSGTQDDTILMFACLCVCRTHMLMITCRCVCRTHKMTTCWCSHAYVSLKHTCRR